VMSFMPNRREADGDPLLRMIQQQRRFQKVTRRLTRWF
jgi:hypothetical protein